MDKIVPDEMTREILKRGGRDYVRELARQRDSRMCQKCYKKWVPGTRRFDIHHIFDCGSKSQAYDRVADLDKLITYCHKCHLGLEEVRKKMSAKTGNYKSSPEYIRAQKRKVEKSNGQGE